MRGVVTFDGVNVASFLASIASGLPGKYVLRMDGAGATVIITSLVIHSYQDGEDDFRLIPSSTCTFC